MTCKHENGWLVKIAIFCDSNSLELQIEDGFSFIMTCNNNGCSETRKFRLDHRAFLEEVGE